MRNQYDALGAATSGAGWALGGLQGNSIASTLPPSPHHGDQAPERGVVPGGKRGAGRVRLTRVASFPVNIGNPKTQKIRHIPWWFVCGKIAGIIENADDFLMY